MTCDIKSKSLREKAIKSNEFLMTKFNGPIQESDITEPTNCDGFGRVHHFKYHKNPNWMSNPLPMIAVKQLFDKNLDVRKTMEVEIFQLSVCNFNCWYCFVDKKLREGNQEFAKFVSPRELLKMCEAENTPKIISLSGGQPDIVPEYQLWFLQEREKLGLDDKYFLWSDDNLSNEFLWEYITNHEIKYMINRPNYVRVGCLKGFDEDSFSFNTDCNKELFNYQIKILKRFVNSGFKQYGYITLTTNELKNAKEKIKLFFDRIQEEISPEFPLKLIPLEIFKYNVNKNEAIKGYLDSQYEVIKFWKEELTKRFSSEQLNNNFIEF